MYVHYTKPCGSFYFVCLQMGITQKTEAVGMYSAEGEYVEFGHSVLLEGPVEVCSAVMFGL